MNIISKNERKSEIGEAGAYVGVVLVARGSEFVTWEYTREKGQNDIEQFNKFWGHYIRDFDSATIDFEYRAKKL